MRRESGVSQSLQALFNNQLRQRSILQMNIALKHVPSPKKDWTGVPVFLSDETMLQRKKKILERMEENQIAQLIVYGDVEHSGNFEYLIGYFPRFEEALLIINQDGTMKLLLGNENLNKASKSRLEVEAIHVSLFSLPNQPDRNDLTLEDLLKQAGIVKEKRIGLVGWKNFTSSIENNSRFFDIPSYIVDTIRGLVNDSQNLVNASYLFIGENGARTTNNANEIAHFEFGASLASDSILDAMNAIDVGVSEMEVADKLVRYGQHTNVVTILASGERFVKANMFPTNKKIELGDPMSVTIGYRGGLSSRGGYAVNDESELPESQQDYLDKVAIPYFSAYIHWLENIHVGQTGGELYKQIEDVLPKETYGWELCPGHLTSYEEWTSSPVYEGSSEPLRSGMIMQVDFIPVMKGYAGVSAESTVGLADEQLQNEIKQSYPDLWERMTQRRLYLKETLGINLSKDVLPMCSTVGYLRPYLLRKDQALAKVNSTEGN